MCETKKALIVDNVNSLIIIYSSHKLPQDKADRKLKYQHSRYFTVSYHMSLRRGGIGGALNHRVADFRDSDHSRLDVLGKKYF